MTVQRFALPDHVAEAAAMPLNSLSNSIKRLVTAALSALAMIAFVPTAAMPQQGLARPPLVIQNDVGGGLRARIVAVEQLRQTERPVQIVGNICYSTCTLYIGLDDACVAAETEFGFHGPSANGNPLDPATFERASRLIAAYYPEPIRNWYLTTARHEINALFKVKGEVLINLGIPAC